MSKMKISIEYKQYLPSNNVYDIRTAGQLRSIIASTPAGMLSRRDYLIFSAKYIERLSLQQITIVPTIPKNTTWLIDPENLTNNAQT